MKRTLSLDQEPEKKSKVSENKASDPDQNKTSQPFLINIRTKAIFDPEEAPFWVHILIPKSLKSRGEDDFYSWKYFGKLYYLMLGEPQTIHGVYLLMYLWEDGKVGLFLVCNQLYTKKERELIMDDYKKDLGLVIKITANQLQYPMSVPKDWVVDSAKLPITSFIDDSRSRNFRANKLQNLYYYSFSGLDDRPSLETQHRFLLKWINFINKK